MEGCLCSVCLTRRNIAQATQDHYALMTRHELGRLADETGGLVPMRTAPEPVRVPPAFPLATYLVMVREGPYALDSLPITSPAIEMLRRGRVLIETRGLARGQLQDRQGKFCTIGAVTRQCLNNGLALNEAIDYLARAIPTEPVDMGIAAWNDAPGRTINDVLEVYDRAIELAVAEALVNA